MSLAANRIEAVIFDKDGVLVDFERTWTPAIRAAALDFASGDEARALDLLRAVGFDEATGAFLPGSVWAAGTNRDLMNVWTRGLPASERRALAARIAASLARVDPVPLTEPRRMQGAFAMLKATGMKLAVVTNDTTASARKTARAFGLSPHLDAILGYDAVDNPKPAADPVHAFARITGIAPARMAVIGDNRHDADMARAGRCAMFIGVLSGNSGRADLSPLTDHLVDDVLEATDLLLDLATPAPPRRARA